ncbi:serpin B [Halopolyspora algeriensis]|uniref:Serpin B n=1 Tax=Halopolyspora algeriensis TaxID=1500506 RepID=A0A368VHP3_9ACTN|nr:serpin family protein [Halopolyspora algeriensis]RCW40778.1 serpin B [Halopolyspora algeriensis]TQM53303.1 serpin B [Halopolyspora algeriensis]
MSNHLDFSLSLHRRLAPRAEEDFSWSPYSVASALGLAAAAADGHTRAELLTALRATGSNSRTELLELLRGAAHPGHLEPEDGPELAVANTLWADDELPIEDTYLQALEDWPGSALRNTAFRAAPDRARRQINADVAETTRDLIPELLRPGTVDPDTVAALVNALYVKASWTESFDEHATESRPFHAPHGTRDVPTMRMTRSFGYASRHGWQVVTLPAAGGIEAVVLLPDGELSGAESGLEATRLAELVSAAGQQRVELLLPRFEVTGEAELQHPLDALGVSTLFTSAADFSPLTARPLRVSTMVHRSVLRVDEHGLEGAAATAAVMRLVSAVREEEPIRVEVDRPFLFLVRHRATGAIYFLARVVDPS